MKSQAECKSTLVAKIIPMILCAAMVMPLSALAQGTAAANRTPKVHHYKLIDMGTLGGPISFLAWPSGRSINSHGTAIAEAETAIGDPYAPICLQPPDCLVNRGLEYRNGTLTDMGALPGGNNSSLPFWINDEGSSVGISSNGLYDPLTGYPEFRATLWKSGKIFDLGTLGGNVSLASAINNRGQVVGGALNAISDNDSNAFNVVPFPVATQFRAFLWQNGAMRDLGTLRTGNNAVALLVNDRSQVAGVSLTNTSANSPTGSFTHDPFFWEDGKMVDIGTLGGTSGGPWYMNAHGQVVGASNLAGDQFNHAFLWDRENGLTDLGTLPGASNSVATWINEAGEIVGAGDFNSGTNSILWKNGQIIDLGRLPGDCASEALAINSQGLIVGNSSPDCISDGSAVIWEDGGAPIDLNTLITPSSNVTVIFPPYINDRGEIAAVGQLPNGDVHSVILIPCDDNHADLEGCDYRLINASEAAQGSTPRYLPSGTPRPPQPRRTSRYHIPGVESPGR